MRKADKTRLKKGVLILSAALIIALSLVTLCSAESRILRGMNRRDAVTSDPPPIGEGLESGINDAIDGLESGANDLIDGAESIVDGIESNVDSIETNIPDPDIGGATADADSDGKTDPTDPDDDNDGQLDSYDTDADNDGIPDNKDTDPDGDGKKESDPMMTLVGLVIAILAIGGIAALLYAMSSKKNAKQ